MRAHPITCPSGQSTVIIMDYLNAQWSMQFVPTGGATYTVNYTSNDPANTEGNDPVVTWFPFPTALVGATTAQSFPGFGTTVFNTLQPIRAIQVVVTAGGSVQAVVLQESGQS